MPIPSFSLRERELLKLTLKSKPRVVLQQFQAVGIDSLSELELYYEICAESPDTAVRIGKEAIALGIPI